MRSYFQVILLGALFFLPFIGEVHLFDWDEINFAECAREMLQTGDYLRPQIDYQPFWEKPPLFIWLQTLSMHFFGINEFAARLPNAICGMFTLAFVFHMGRTIYNERFAWLWVWVWLASFLPHFYFKSGIIDPWFNFLIVLSLWLFFIGKCRDNSEMTLWGNSKYFIGAGMINGLAILTKGPVAILVAGLVIGGWWLLRRTRDRRVFFQFPIFLLAALLVTSLWFGADILAHGWWFTKEFTRYQIRLFTESDAGHAGFIGYHFVVFLLGCFVASAYAAPWLFRIIAPLKSGFVHDQRSVFSLWMWILFWVVMVLFSIVSTKIVHYSSLIYYPATFYAAHAMYTCEKWNLMPRITKYVLTVVGLLIGGLLVSLPWIGGNISRFTQYFESDAFVLGNLQADVSWSAYHALPGVFMSTGTILALWFFSKKRMKNANNSILAAGVLTVSSAIYTLPDNIEAYSQYALIEFCKSKANEDCIVNTYKYKSYAHLFYTRKRPQDTSEAIEDQQVKPIYLISKVQYAHELDARQDLMKIGQKNGFVFYKKQ